MVSAACEYKKKHEVFAVLLQAWAAGAVCFFLFMTSFLSLDVLDSVIIAGITHYLVQVLLLIPLMNSVFETRLRKRKRLRKNLWSRIALNLWELLEQCAIVLAVIFCYQGLNELLILLFHTDADKVLLSVEPITYGILYAAVYSVLYFLQYGLIVREKK